MVFFELRMDRKLINLDHVVRIERRKNPTNRTSGGDFTTTFIFQDGTTQQTDLFIDDNLDLITKHIVPAHPGVLAAVVFDDDPPAPPVINRVPIIAWLVGANNEENVQPVLSTGWTDNVYVETPDGAFYAYDEWYKDEAELIAAVIAKRQAAA